MQSAEICNIKEASMNRLTLQRVNGIKTGYWSPVKKDELIQRLGKYEDLDMEPEEIRRRLKEKRGEKKVQDQERGLIEYYAKRLAELPGVEYGLAGMYQKFEVKRKYSNDRTEITDAVVIVIPLHSENIEYCGDYTTCRDAASSYRCLY